MSNPYYTKTGIPATQSRGLSSLLRNEFLLIEQGFDGVQDSPVFTGEPEVPTPDGANLNQAANVNYVLQASLTGQIPAQTGNNGKFLRTNGSVVSWADAVPVGGTIGLIATSNTVTIDGATFLKSGQVVHPSTVTNWPAWATQPNDSFVTTASGHAGAIRSLASDGNGVWVSSQATAIRRSTDGGATWGAVTSGFASTIRSMWFGNNVFIAGGDSGAMRRCTDGGVTWNSVTSGFSASYAINSLATDGAGVWVAGNGNGEIRRSTDNGATWGAVTSGFSAGQAVMRIVYGNGAWVACASPSGGMRLSTDGGVTWGAIATGVVSTGSYALATNGAGVWVVGGSGGSKRSTDNGATWADITVGFATYMCATVDGIGNWWIGSYSEGLRKSTDNGVTWSAISHGFGTDPVYELISDDGIVTIAAGGGGSAILQRRRYAIGMETVSANEYLRIA